MLPTRIGNRMRVAEAEAFAGSAEDYETAVLEVFHELPVHLQSQHDTHRRQLGLYATLMVVVVVTGGTAAVALGLEHGGGHVAWSVGLTVALTALCHLAMLRAVEGYGSALRAIRRWRESDRAQASLPPE